MNERIRELAEQAEEWVCKNYPDAMDDNDEFHAQTMEKFAELIVQKCVEIAQRTGELNEADFEGEMIADAIKEQFGVKL